MNRISIAMPVFNGNEKKYLNECIDTGWVSANGRFIEEFQNQFAEFCGSKYALACSNGTVTLHLALLALGVGPGDEVVMPTLTYIATANAVKYCGATPVFVDSELDTWNVDPYAIEKAITPKTKAIIPVHLYGLPANMTEIMKISEKYGIPVIEDAAEAHGAIWEGKRVGSIGTIGSFSFFGNKIVTSGEGGMLVTNDDKLYERMKFLRSQGVDPNKRYWHLELAYNYRMTNMQAAVGLGQLENIEWHMGERKRVAELYKKYLKGMGEYVVEQYVPLEATHSYWMYTILLTDRVKKSRDDVMKCMEDFNIEMRPTFYPMHIMPPYHDEKVHCINAEHIGARGINMPTHSMLTEEQVKYIVECLKRSLK